MFRTRQVKKTTGPVVLRLAEMATKREREDTPVLVSLKKVSPRRTTRPRGVRILGRPHSVRPDCPIDVGGLQGLPLVMVKKKSNGALKRSRTVKRKLPKANSALKKKTSPKASALSAEPMDEMDLLSEALSKSLKTREAETENDTGNSASRAISKKKHNRARRAAKRKVVKVRANALAQRARRRGIARN